jgi:hypoxanthine phosphoribosyltransferase
MSTNQNNNTAPLPPGVGPVVFSEAQIQARVMELGEAISRDYAEADLVLIGILKGIVFFMADLLRSLHTPVIVDFMSISRFGPSEETQGAARLLKDLDLSLHGRHALIIEIIVETGFTLSYMLRTLQARQPASLGVCTLLDRPKHRLIDVPLNYMGFEAPEEFIVGYGLHYREKFRQLPYIAYYDPKKGA